MEAGTHPLNNAGSQTIADLAGLAAEKFADRPMARYKTGGEWRDVTYAEVGAIASEIGRGLIDLGVQHGDRVCILANTRPEWTYTDLAITSTGAIVVPIYQTNAPEECEWVVGNSEASTVVCEDVSQLAKILEVRERLPHLQHLVVMDGAGDTSPAVSLDDLRARGRERDEAVLRERAAAVTAQDTFTIIYTSGTTGPPKGCVLSHGNYRAILDACEGIGVLSDEGELTYLFLPLAHSFALLIQLLTIDLGGTIAYFGGDTKQVVAELQEVRPTYLPSVPRIFEKIYTLVTSQGDPELIKGATRVGLKVRELQAAGQEVPAELQTHFDGAEERLFKNVRAAFGGNLRQAVTGAAPISKEILEFFYACGVPVMEGFGMTETATAATISTTEHHKFGTVGKPLPGVEAKIAEDGELLIKGPNVFQGYYKNDDASFGAIIDGWLHTGDLGAIDDEGYVSIVGRKKDIIITAGGKNLTPANIENDLKQSRWVSQAVMHGDRRPYPVMLLTLDEEEIVPWAKSNGIDDTSIPALAAHPEVHALLQAELDKANAKYAQVEQVKKFFVLEHDLAQETGELTPTLKVKRNVVNEMYEDRFDALYSG